MSNEPLHDLVRYRWEQAQDSLREAEILQEAAAPRGAIDRAYYAMFYALSALLATRHLGTSKHSGAISLFDREFVKTGIFPTALSKALQLAFDQRQTYDYGEMIAADATSSREAIAAYLRQQGMA